jgi:copper homeostasis protein
MSFPLFEVSVEGVDGLIAAQENGADRVELCASVLEGGITPTIGSVREALRVATVPVFPIVRPRGGDFLYSHAEFESMRLDILAFKDLGVPGVVSGCLLADGQIDSKRTAEMVALAGPMTFAYHRAFDMVRDADEALEALIAAGVKRVLTSGLHATALDGLKTLMHLGELAGDRITVMPCGSIRPDNIVQICRETGLREFHFAAPRHEASAMIYRNPNVVMGDTAQDHEYQRTITDPAVVRATVDAGRGAYAI